MQCHYWQFNYSAPGQRECFLTKSQYLGEGDKKTFQEQMANVLRIISLRPSESDLSR